MNVKQEQGAKSAKRMEDAMGRISGTIGKVQTALGVGGLVGVASMAIGKFDELATRGLNYGNVMSNLPFSIEKATTATRGMVSQFDLGQAAVAASTLGIAKTDEAFAAFAEQAVKLGARMGKDAKSSIEEWTMAIGRGSVKIADNFGVTVKVAEAQEKYAKSLNKTVEELSEEEKGLAVSKALMLKAAEVTRDSAIHTRGLAAEWVKFKVALSDATDAAVGMASSTISNDTLTQGYAKTLQTLGVTAEDLAKKHELGATATKTIEHVSKEYGITVEQLERRLRELEDPTARLASHLLPKTIERYKDATQAGDEFTQSLIEQSRAMGLVVTAQGETFGSAIASFEASRKALTDARRKGLGMTPEQNRAMAEARERALREKERRGKRGGKKEEERTGSATRLFDATAGAGIDEDLQEQRRVAEEKAREDELAQIIDFEQRRAEIQFDQRMMAIEEQRVAGVDPLQLIADEEAAQIRLLDIKMKVAGDIVEQEAIRSQKEQVHHVARLRRIEEEKKAEQLKLQTISTVTQAIGTITGAGSQIIGMAIDANIKNEEKAARAKMIAGGVQAMVIGALETVNAAAAYASFNFPQAIAHTAAAAVAFAQGGLMLSGQIGGARSLGGGGGAGSVPRGGSSGGRSGGRSIDPGGTPVSPDSNRAPRTGGQGARPGSDANAGGMVIQINGDVLGSVDKEFTQKIDRGLRDLGREGRRVSNG